MLGRIVNLAGVLAVGGIWTVAVYTPAPLPRMEPPKTEAPAEPAAPKKAEAAPAKSVASYHAAALQAFEETPGFGKGRMILTHEYIREIYVQWSPGELEMDAPAIAVPGLVESHAERVGLLAKGSEKHPESAPVTSIHADGGKARWRLRSVDLLALVDHEQPVVYVTAKLGRRGAGHAAKQGKAEAADSRGLDFFEIAGLEKLRRGDEMFVRTKDATLRMVGALRAGKTCLECHDGKEGDLFGAFSYTLSRIGE